MIYTIVHYLLWPFLWLYTPLTRRSRVLIIQDNKLLVVKGKLGPNVWQLPGGGIKFGESAVEAAKRELKEELYLDAVKIDELNDSFIVCRQFGLLFRLHFFAVSIKKDATITIQKSEIRDYTWLAIDDLKNVAPEVRIALSLAHRQR